MISRVLAAFVALVAAAQCAAAEPTDFLARHAEKADGAADPKNPELSAAGQTRAELLGRMLKDAGVSAIFATEFARTRQTAEQVRRATGAAITIMAARDTGALIQRVKAAPGNSVIIGHSNTLPEIIKALGVDEPIGIADDEYDNLFIWNPNSPRGLVRLRY